VAVTREDDGVPSRPPRAGLTAEAFEALLARLDPDRERAGERYEVIRHKLIRLFDWRGCEDPEDLADETINRVARRLAEGVQLGVSDPYSYCCGVAHLVFKEVCRNRDRERRRMEAEPAVPLAVFPEPEEDERYDALRGCLGRLPPNPRSLLLRYYEGEDRIRGRRRLAEELGIPLNALRIRVHRVRRAVEDCLQRRLRSLSETFSAGATLQDGTRSRR
jgi:DNA-directed RNA polymerase specialized sigma24 family protein